MNATECLGAPSLRSWGAGTAAPSYAASHQRTCTPLASHAAAALCLVAAVESFAAVVVNEEARKKQVAETEQYVAWALDPAVLAGADYCYNLLLSECTSAPAALPDVAVLPAVMQFYD